MEALPLRGEAAETNGGPNKKSKPYLKGKNLISSSA